MNNFEFMYQIGATVYLIKSKRHIYYPKCSLCKGSEKVNIEGNDYICPKCHGEGTSLQEIHSGYTVKKLIITEQHMHIRNTEDECIKTEHYVCIDTTGDTIGLSYDVKELYPSKGVAKDKIKELVSKDKQV